MTSFENEQIKHQIYLEQYKTGQANKILALLDTANRRIATYIKQTDGVYTKARYKEVAKKLKEISTSLKDNIENGTDIDGIIEYELRKQKKFFNDVYKLKGFEDVNINTLLPSVEQIKTSALFNPVTQNVTFQSYLDSIEANLYNVWDSNIRTGYLLGETTSSIVHKVIGSLSQNAKVASVGEIETLRKSVYNNTRTVLQAFANETRSKVYEKNEQYFGDDEGYKYEYLATLDSRTCVVCGNCDGKKYKSLKDAPHIPQHQNCRCMILPYFGDIEGEFRASKDGYVKSNITYEDWLNKQDDETQKEVLGATRFKLFKEGEPITNFVSNNKILTLEELNEKLESPTLKNIFEKKLKSTTILEDNSEIVERISKYDFMSKSHFEDEDDRNNFISDLKTLDTKYLKLLEKYTKDMKVDFNFYDDVAHYEPTSKIIHFGLYNASDELFDAGYHTNIRSFVHEVGHWLDFNMDKFSLTVKLDKLNGKLEKEAVNYVNSILSNGKKIKVLSDVQSKMTSDEIMAVRESLSSFNKNSVSDIFDGLTNHTIRGLAGHSEPNYWNNLSIRSESIAHFFESMALKNPDIDIVEKIFAKSYKYFYNSIE